MIFHCDALLPIANRYISGRFRRFAALRLLDAVELRELIAFVETVGLRQSSFIFRWGQARVQTYRVLRAQIQASDEIRANMASVGIDDGLAILRAMRDGGWKAGKLSPVTKAALKNLRKSMSLAEISRMTGLTREQVKTGVGVREKTAASSRNLAYAALAIG